MVLLPVISVFLNIPLFPGGSECVLILEKYIILIKFLIGGGHVLTPDGACV